MNNYINPETNRIERGAFLDSYEGISNRSMLTDLLKLFPELEAPQAQAMLDGFNENKDKYTNFGDYLNENWIEGSQNYKAPMTMANNKGPLDDVLGINNNNPKSVFDNSVNEKIAQTEMNNTIGSKQNNSNPQSSFAWYNPTTWFDESTSQIEQLRNQFKNDPAFKGLNPIEQEQYIQNRMVTDSLDDFDWQGWSGVGLGGLNLGMDLGMYGDKKDFLNSSVDALNQNIEMSQEAWDQKQDTRNSYSSAFSNGAQ